jgi:hypothetical protein
MSRGLWFFTGSVPEEGDYALVWASSEAEAMAEGRRVAGYADDPDYGDEDFSVRLATAAEILAWAPSLIREVTGGPVETDVLDTEVVRTFLTEQVQALTTG